MQLVEVLIVHIIYIFLVKIQFSGGKGQSAFASLYTNGGVPCR